jgi:cobalamin biosynthesis protein CobT
MAIKNLNPKNMTTPSPGGVVTQKAADSRNSDILPTEEDIESEDDELTEGDNSESEDGETEDEDDTETTDDELEEENEGSDESLEEDGDHDDVEEKSFGKKTN